MDAVTYPDDGVIAFIQDHLIPLRLEHDDKQFSREYNIIWTPTMLVIDQDGLEYQRTIGFLSPEEMLPNLMLAVAKVYFNTGNYAAAKMHLDMIEKQYPKSDSAPEALYFRGANQYKKKNDPKELKKAYESLEKDYPGSAWAKRAAPFRLL